MIMTRKDYLKRMIANYGPDAKYDITCAEMLELIERIEQLDKRSLSTAGLKSFARRCGCPSCEAALQNINYTIKDYSRSIGSARRWARNNRVYFIQRLREIVVSENIKHERI